MPPKKRMRIFAGPNGSGKTTIVQKLQGEISFGVYINADDIELMIRQTGKLLFKNYQLIVSESQFSNFIKLQSLSRIRQRENQPLNEFEVRNNTLIVHGEMDAYLAADIAEFLRQNLLLNGTNFSYETVMSHISKIELMRKARELGYRVYLYYIATNDPEINISRVNVRVDQQGHGVPIERIRKRYFRSIELLKQAIKLSNRAYIWDNSGSTAAIFAEITEGREVLLKNEVPAWFDKNVMHQL